LEFIVKVETVKLVKEIKLAEELVNLGVVYNEDVA